MGVIYFSYRGILSYLIINGSLWEGNLKPETPNGFGGKIPLMAVNVGQINLLKVVLSKKW